MEQNKPFASLSSGLLARKGEAKPAMRRQTISFGQQAALPHALEDLGWDDMGLEDTVHDTTPVSINDAAPVATPAAPMPAVVEQQRELAREFAPASLMPGSRGRAVPGSKSKAAFTLRLDPDRHLQLRLVCAVKHTSAQQIVTLALDEYLARQPALVPTGAAGDQNEQGN